MAEPARPALLLMDFQRGIVEPAASSGSLQAVAAAKRALAHARQAGMPVIHVVVKFRPSYIDIAASNKRLSGLKAAGRLREDDPLVEVVADLVPAPGEAVVVKRRFSALAHTGRRCCAAWASTTW